jgi:putative methionine-R-sulfoxide reductase with GAF domain
VPDAVTRFLDRSSTMLVRLDEQLQLAESAHEAAWIICEYTGRELILADCVVYLPEGQDMLLQTAAWGPKRAASNMLESRIRLAVGKGVVGDCARRLQVQRVDDTRSDSRYVADDQVNLSELAVPIHHGPTLLAVMDSENPYEGFYDARYEQAFEAIAVVSATHLWRMHGDAAAPART